MAQRNRAFQVVLLLFVKESPEKVQREAEWCGWVYQSVNWYLKQVIPEEAPWVCSPHLLFPIPNIHKDGDLFGLGKIILSRLLKSYNMKHCQP